MAVLGGLIYLGLIILGTALSIYLYVRQNNYCFENTAVGPVRFQSKLSFLSLFWIRFSNILAIILTAGLFSPWARVRRHRYIVRKISVLSTVDLDVFSAVQEDEVSALGDVAADFFDLDIGL